MYFYSVNDNEYIKSLKEALKKEGLRDDNEEDNIVEFKIKDSFLEDEMYQSGYVYLNEQIPINQKQEVNGLDFYSSNYKRFVTSIDNSDNDILLLDDNDTNITEDISYKHHESFYIRDHLDLFRLAINKKPFFYFSNIKKFLPNITSISMLCSDDKYLSEVDFIMSTTEIIDISETMRLKVFLSYLDFLQNAIEKNYRQHKGTKEFMPVRISDRLKNKVIKAKDSDKTIYQDNSWYVFESHKGTSEEYSFVNFIAENMSKLKDYYSDIKLIRNEKAFEIYAFEGVNNGSRFEPDFILLAKHKEDDKYYQIFCEPKGEHLLEKDSWKEELLNGITSLTDKNKLILGVLSQPDLQINETKHYKIYGLPFYTKQKEDLFKDSFGKLMLI